VARLFAEGEALIDDEQDEAALGRFQAAWELLPEPKDKHEQSIQLLAAIADCRFVQGDWDRCRQAVQHAFRCGGDTSNTFLRLRLGQSLFELGDAEAANWLAPVYIEDGKEPFEQDDPKYLAFVRSKLLPPPGGWPEGW
jgi:hypothetical protein